MCRASKEQEKRLARTLTEAGISSFEFSKRRKHSVLTFSVGERRCRYFFPSTPSDWRGPHNAVSDLKRVIREARARAE